LLDRLGAVNGLFLIRRSTRSADCLTLDICFEREKKHYVITHFVSWMFSPLICLLQTFSIHVYVYTTTGDFSLVMNLVELQVKL